MEQIQNYISTLQRTLNDLEQSIVSDVIFKLQSARMRGNQIFIMGNGGSASTASHFVCDLAKNTRYAGLPHYRVIGLADNMEILSAYANDEGYESVFSQQLINLVKPEDIVIAISASGNSMNVVNAVEEAQRHNATTIGFTGFDGGRLGQLADIHMNVNSRVIEHVEDIHLMLEHMIVRTIKDQPTIGINVTDADKQIVATVLGG
jgi:D-sedoheptulose 7-phosphate isomerase